MDCSHTTACQKQQAAYIAYVAKWPKYCRKCHGVGFHTSHATLWEPDEVWECAGCCGKVTHDDPNDAYFFVTCPRCAQPHLRGDEQMPCPDCGWNYGKNPDDYAPDVECGCWEEEQ